MRFTFPTTRLPPSLDLNFVLKTPEIQASWAPLFNTMQFMITTIINIKTTT